MCRAYIWGLWGSWWDCAKLMWWYEDLQAFANKLVGILIGYMRTMLWRSFSGSRRGRGSESWRCRASTCLKSRWRPSDPCTLQGQALFFWTRLCSRSVCSCWGKIVSLLGLIIRWYEPIQEADYPITWSFVHDTLFWPFYGVDYI